MKTSFPALTLMTPNGRRRSQRHCAQRARKPARWRYASWPKAHSLTTSRVLTRPDFAEGVRAVIVEKSHDPKWDPATPEGVSDELIDGIFAPLPADQEWKPL